jgi:hypothetical protein
VKFDAVSPAKGDGPSIPYRVGLPCAQWSAHFITAALDHSRYHVHSDPYTQPAEPIDRRQSAAHAVKRSGHQQQASPLLW